MWKDGIGTMIDFIFYRVQQVIMNKKSIGNYRNRISDVSEVGFANLENPFTMYHLLLQGEGFFDWLKDNSLIARTMVCEVDQCGLAMRWSKRVNALDGFSWRCKKQHEQSIRKHSYFYGSKFCIQDVIVFLVEFAKHHSLKSMAKSSGITYGHSAVNYASSIREMFKWYVGKYYREHKYKGTVPVECDESLFGQKVKHSRGNPNNSNNKVWIFGKYIHTLFYNHLINRGYPKSKAVQQY